MCSKISSSKYKSTLTALQLFLSKIQEGGCIAKASLQYTLPSEDRNLEGFKMCLAALIEDLQDQLKLLPKEVTQLPSSRSSICFPTLLATPTVVPESIKGPEKTSEGSCSVDTALRIEGDSMNITENFVQAPATAHSLRIGAPSSCVYSSSQLAVIDATEKIYHTASDPACKNSANQMHMGLALTETHCGSAIAAEVNCPANVGLMNGSQCPVVGEQHSMGPLGLSYNNVSSLPILSISCNGSQNLKPKDGSYNSDGISPNPQLTDNNASSEYIAENSLPVVHNSSSYSFNFEAPHPDATIRHSPPIGMEIPSSNLFNGAAHVLDQSMTEPPKKIPLDGLSVESLKSLPFLCCKICTNVFLLLESFSGHACKSLEMTSEKSVAQNIIRSKNKLNELKKFTCSICGIELRSVRRMAYHLPRCRPGPYCCGVCTAQYQHRPALHLHMKTQHRCMSCHVCEECGKKFERRTSLQKHVILRHETAAAAGPFRCDACPKKFIRRIYLTNHKLRMHQLPKPFTCEVCGSGLLTAASLAVHQRCVHGASDQGHPCSHCGKTFSRKEKLVVHLRRHTGERPFVCEVCSRGFVSKSKLQEHQTRQHLPQHARRRHPCALCHKTYANRADLRKHASRVHGAKRDEGSGGAAALSPPCSADRRLPPTSRGDTSADTE